MALTHRGLKAVDRETFMLACHDMAITARIAGLKDFANELAALEIEAAGNFGRLFWCRRRASRAFMGAVVVWQESLAEALQAH